MPNRSSTLQQMSILTPQDFIRILLPMCFKPDSGQVDASEADSEQVTVNQQDGLYKPIRLVDSNKIRHPSSKAGTVDINQLDIDRLKGHLICSVICNASFNLIGGFPHT